MQRVVGPLAATELEIGGSLHFVDTYTEVRSVYLKKSLLDVSTPMISIDQKKVTTYAKGTSLFIKYSNKIMHMFKMERELVAKIIPKTVAQSAFQRVIAPSLEPFLEEGDRMVEKARKCLQKKEYIDVYILIDVVDELISCLKEYDGVIAFAGSKGAEILELS
ncbi:hypothetical protein HK096_001575, partial [Nowakowskiella sp. JEL0078]